MNTVRNFLRKPHAVILATLLAVLLLVACLAAYLPNSSKTATAAVKQSVTNLSAGSTHDYACKFGMTVTPVGANEVTVTCAASPSTTTTTAAPSTTTTVPDTTTVPSTTIPSTTTTTTPSTTSTTVASGGGSGCTYGPAAAPSNLYPWVDASGSLPGGPVLPGWPWSEQECAQPDASNTGPTIPTVVLTSSNAPAGTSWDGHTLTITKANTVVQGFEIDGAVLVDAPNVELLNDRVIDHTNTYTDGIVVEVDYRVSNASLVVVRSEVDGGNGKACGDDLGFGNFAVLWSNMHSCGDILRPNGSVLVQDSWFHDTPDVTGSSHNDTLQVTEGSYIDVLHSRFDNQTGETSAMQLGPDQGDIAHVLFYGNILNGGGYAFYGGAHGSGYTTDAQVIDNRWMRLPQSGAFYAKGGFYGPVNNNGPDNFQGNVWDDSGQLVAPNATACAPRTC